MRHPLRALFVGALAVGLAATGCQANTGNSDDKTGGDTAQASFIVDYEGTAPVPAPEVPGATKGGVLTILQEGDFEHLAPQQIYVSNALDYAQFFHRGLTGYIEDPDGGPLKVVGDLATNAGVTTDEGKTWTYTLRDGVKFEDGTPVTSKDVAYGIAVSFSDFGVQGPQYLQAALDPSQTYKGPYSGTLLPPGVTTPDDKTIVFSFAEPHPETPFLLAYPTSTPIPQAKDTKEKYETAFVSTGPYKIKEYKRDVSLVLERNPNWDPKTDPIRHQYVDEVKFDFTPDSEAQTNRLIAAQGDDAAAIMTQNVAPTKINEVNADSALAPRAVKAPTPFVRYLNINTSRVTDVAVRQALNYAVDKDAYTKALGGYDVTQPASTILAPVVPGFKQFDAYPPADPNGNHGDVEKAKALLDGKTVPKLKACFFNTPTYQGAFAVIQNSLAKAGFEIALAPIDPSSYYTTVGVKDTDCDLIFGGWGQDYPDGDSTIGVLLDGTKIVDKGNNNFSYLNDSATNAKIAELRAMTDRGAAAPLYGDLDETIMKDVAPLIPLGYVRFFALYGPKVGGTFASPLFAVFNVTGIYIKQ